MEFVKVGKNYMIKGSNGRIVSEKEKLQLENKELVLKDIKGCDCQKETTKKISKNKKRIAEIEKENVKINVDLQPIDSEKIVKHIKEIMEEDKKEKFISVETYDTAQKGESADDIIKETNTTI